MKISICFIHYNRINFLLESLRTIKRQSYPDIEIVISDDASTDETQLMILELKNNYKYPIVYYRNEVNLGYDRNYRRAIELASGEYCITMGNDDTIIGDDSISEVVDFLNGNGCPDLGFVNYFEFSNPNLIIKRATRTTVLGTGLDIAIKYYNCFSFVGGLIYKRESFLKYNSDIHDGSIYSQMHLGMSMIINGCYLFSIDKPMVGKDIVFKDTKPYSFRDNLVRSWLKFKVVDGGLPSVIRVILSAIELSGKGNSKSYFTVFYKIYSRTLPYWIFEYKRNRAKPSALGLILGMYPGKNPDFKRINLQARINIYFLYLFASLSAFIIPHQLFFKYVDRLYMIGRN